MTEETKRKLNPTEAIINALPRIIEAFVIFYGESERERITDKFKNMLVIGYAQPHHISYIINQSNKEKSTLLINELLEKLTDKQEEREKLKKLFFKDYELHYASLQPINQYISYVNGINTSNYNKYQVVEFLRQIHPETTIDNLDELIKLGTFKNIDVVVPIYEQTLKKYQKYLIEMKPYTDYINLCNQLTSTLNKKYIKKLTEQLKDLFTEEEYSQIQVNINDGYLRSVQNINGKTKNYIGYSLNSPILIEAFSAESDELLVTGNSWKKDSIKKDRIEYFNNLGLDLGDDYEAYLNNSRAKELTPSKELVERIVNTTKNMYTMMINEYYTSLPEYQKNRARIEEQGLLDKEDGYNADAYEKGSTAITTNLKLVNGQYVLNPILFLYIGSMEEYFDHNLIHELNHVYELFLQSIKGNSYQMICGWDICDGEINNQSKETVEVNQEREKRNYELFNEIINELIAQEISEILSKLGIYIFNNKENKKIKGGTSYESTMFLVKTFYETYKKEIIESRKNGNLSVLFEVVGKENFEELNQLFHEYNENFNGFMLIQVYNDLKNGVETEKTIKMKELVSRRNAILAKMEEHSHKRKASL